MKRSRLRNGHRDWLASYWSRGDRPGGGGVGRPSAIVRRRKHQKSHPDLIRNNGNKYKTIISEHAITQRPANAYKLA